MVLRRAIARIGGRFKEIGSADRLIAAISGGDFAARESEITVRRVTAIQLETLAENGDLVAGEPFLITDQSRFAIADGPFVYTAFAKMGEGDDGWTDVKLGANFVTSSAAAVDTGLSIAPILNSRIQFEARLLLRTATNTVGPRPGLAWPTGMTDGAAMIMMPSSATANLISNGNINAAMLITVGGVPNANQSYLATIQGMMLAGGAPGSSLRVQLASETAGTNVTMMAQSFIRWRDIP